MARKSVRWYALGLFVTVAFVSGYIVWSRIVVDSATASSPPGVVEYLERADVPSEQGPALADGYVTHDEHEAAIQRAIACATAAGVRMQPIPGAGLRPTRPGFVSTDDAERSDSQSKLGMCVDTYLSVVESVRAAQPVDDALIARASSLLAACMNSRLVDANLSGSTVRVEMERLLAEQSRDASGWAKLRAWDDCRQSTEAETGRHF
jgi:hypothetical protein